MPEDTAILVVGGYGAVGRHIVARLHASLPHARIIVAGRALDKAQALADTFASRVSARQIDLTSRASIDAVFPLASLVVLNTEAGTQMAARACIDHGISMVTVAASVPVLRALEELSAQARAAQVSLVTEVGLGPDLTNLMLHEVVRQLPGATVAQVIVQLGLIGEHGAEAMDWTMARSLEARSAVRIDPALPAIGRHVIAVDFVDPDKMERELRVDTVFSALALSPKWSTRLLPVLAPVLARFPTLLSVSQPVLTGVFGALRLTGDSVLLVARAGASPRARPRGRTPVCSGGYRDRNRLRQPQLREAQRAVARAARIRAMRKRWRRVRADDDRADDRAGVRSRLGARARRGAEDQLRGQAQRGAPVRARLRGAGQPTR